MRNKLGLFRAAKVDVSAETADKFLCALANVPEYDDSPDGPNATKDEHGAIHVTQPSAITDAWQRIYNLFPDLLPSHGNPEHERLNAFTAAPGVVWEDPDDIGSVSVGDIPPKLRLAWTMSSLQGRKMFLLSELAYYLRGPAMMAAALKARQAESEKRAQAELEGATADSTFHTGYQAWKDVWDKECKDLSSMWAAADADAFAQVLLRAFEVADRMRHCPTANCPAPYFIARRRSQKYCSDACALPAQRAFKRTWWREHANSRRTKHTITSRAARSQSR
ncbi:MAG TPA: hypothetical protein VJT08_21700 [Terriglobales bacterium]|nr:hypothetical protein [Terriglobales bacterium]